MQYLDCDEVICRDIPDSFKNCLTMEIPIEPINVELARKQHKNYENELSKVLKKVVRLEADNQLPDCCFVEGHYNIFHSIFFFLNFLNNRYLRNN